MSASDAPVAREQRGRAPPDVCRPDRRLTRGQRISQSRLFQEAYDHGSRHVGRLMVLWLRSGPGAALRLGVVASKRSFRRAVDRARVKRLLREAYRLSRHRYQGAYDVVLIARRPLLDVKRQEAEADLLRLARKAGLVKE